MAEINEEVVKEVMKSKSNCYDNRGKYNFVIPTEITVTITLDEYRKLIEDTALAEAYKVVSMINSDKACKTLRELDEEDNDDNTEICAQTGGNCRS